MRPLLLAALLLLPDLALAKDLRQRVGVGMSRGLSPVGALSVRYGLPAKEPAVNFQAELVAGASVLAGSADTIFVGARGLYGVVAEDNMNLYLGVGAGYLQEGDRTGLRVQPAASMQFFPFGLENLGISAEMGLNFDYVGGLDIVTSAVPAACVHYYF